MSEQRWYQNTVIYSLSVDSFLDSDGDGIGDFGGLLSRLDYLHGLGIGAIWLKPFHPSPREDHGYDVADYYGVDPRYGTLGDFVDFSHACRSRGMRVMIDLVLNHTSDQHPWFQAAISDPGSKYRDYYIWSDTKPADAHEGMVFPGVQDSTWTYSRKAKAWYFHRFFDFQPDLNIANPHVQEELLKIIGFWLELGVSGFRMDAVPFLIAADGIHVEDAEPAYDFLRRIRSLAQWRKGDAVFLAEANIPAEECIKYFGESGDRLHMMFNFPVNQTLFYALASGDTGPLREKLEASRDLPPDAQWAHFLRNHDELDIGALPDDQREQTFAAFGPDKDMQLYDRGIRRRLAPMLGGDRRRLELAYSLLLTMPGTPVIRYGDEIGMGDDLDLPEREAVRTPMQWSQERNGGFTPSDSPVRPPIARGPYSHAEVNVARQRAEEGSLLNWTERMLRMRKELPEIGRGSFRILPAAAHVLAMCYTLDGKTSIFVHNLSEQRIDLRIDALPEENEERPLVCIHTNEAIHLEDGCYHLMLEASGYRWLRLGGLEDMLTGDGAGGGWTHRA